MIKFLPIFLLAGCQSFDNPPQTSGPSWEVEQVSIRKNIYCDLARKEIESKGYSVSRCDGLLFTALHNLACGYPSLDPFEVGGQWYRSPTHQCFTPPDHSNGADSTISKDMYAGLLLNLAVKKDRTRAKRALAYCNKNRLTTGLGCQVGKGDGVQIEASKTILPPTTIKILEDIANGTKTHSEGTKQPILKGYQAHLQILRQLLIGAQYGGISDYGLELLKEQAEREPFNPLYQAAYHLYSDGEMTGAAELWLKQCPNGRLPNNHDDFCTDYLYQRDFDNSDWATCKNEQKRTHDGTDCVFAAAVITEDIK